jgi:multiple sugar transport system ATP-binding protein
VVQQVGDPLQLYNQPANRFVAGFIGSPAMNFVDVTVADNSNAIWVSNRGLRIKLPEAYAGRVRPYVGKPLTLGVRPEDLRIAAGADASELAFDSVVEVVEQLGSETLLDVKAGPSTMVAAVEPMTGIRHQDPVRLAVNPTRLHFFDNETGAAL